MKNTLCAVFAFLGIFAFTAFAADVNGKYTADVPGRQGATMPTTFELKTSGGAVTGVVSNERGEMPIADGKISGDTVTFTTTMKMQDREMKWSYTGKVSGSSIDFSRSMEGRDGDQKFTATKK